MTRSYVTLQRVLSLLGLDAAAVARLVQRGWLMPKRVGDQLLFPRGQVAWIKKQLETHPTGLDQSSTIDLDQYSLKNKFPIDLVNPTIADTYQIIPIDIDGEGIVIACGDPSIQGLAEELAVILGKSIRLVKAEPEQIRRLTNELYPNQPRILSPVRNSEGRLTIDSEDNLKPINLNKGNERVRKWYAEPGDSQFVNQELGPRVFIAMPFHPKFDTIYETISNAIDHCGGRSLRIDQVPNLRNIWLAIEAEIARCDVLVADFTGDVALEVANPNVVTEATIAHHKYDRPVVICTQSTAALFFDWRHQFALVYENTHEGLIRLYQHLVDRLTAEFAYRKTIQNEFANNK